MRRAARADAGAARRTVCRRARPRARARRRAREPSPAAHRRQPPRGHERRRRRAAQAHAEAGRRGSRRKRLSRPRHGAARSSTSCRTSRFALRQLRKSPGFTRHRDRRRWRSAWAPASPIFGFVDAALLRPLPYRDPTRLVDVTETTPQIPRANLSYPDYLDWKATEHGVQLARRPQRHAATCWRRRTARELVPGARVSDGFFRTLGRRARARPRLLRRRGPAGAAADASSSATRPGRTRFGGRRGRGRPDASR